MSLSTMAHVSRAEDAADALREAHSANVFNVSFQDDSMASPAFQRTRQPAELHDMQLVMAITGEPAKALFKRFRSLTEVFGADRSELERYVSPAAARAIHCTQEAAKRLALANVTKRNVISSWAALLAYAKVAMAGAEREQFRVLFLDKKNQLISDEVMNSGTVDHAPVYPREVIRRALELNASAVILAHNHPSGDPTPSTADVEMTRQVMEAGKPLRVTVHDHIVVGREGVASLKSLGLV